MYGMNDKIEPILRLVKNVYMSCMFSISSEFWALYIGTVCVCLRVCVCLKSCKNAQKLRANYYDISHGSIALNVSGAHIEIERARARSFDLLLAIN